jgi:pilus assembly protein CpaF
MGPTLTRAGKITAFWGVKGGVGCSVLVSLLARTASKDGSRKIAVLDATPFSFSLTPSYLSIPSVSHHLLQLLPYQDQLTAPMIESFFSRSPEGLSYIPLRQTDETTMTAPQLFALLESIRPYFTDIYLDLSSFPSDQHLFLLEKSDDAFLVADAEPASLTAVRQWEKRLLPLHIPLDHFGLIFTQRRPSGILPPPTETWSKHFRQIGSFPFLKEDLALQLHENRELPPSTIKSLLPLLEKIREAQESATPSGSTPPSATRDKSPGDESDPVSESFLGEQVHQLHQKLLDRLRESGVLQGSQKTPLAQEQTLGPQAREILDQLIQDIKLPDRLTRQRLVLETFNLAFGLGPLEPLLKDPEITEIMVNGPSQVYVEKKGLLEKTKLRFRDNQQLQTVIERILAPIGRRIDESQPYVDGRLSDGSRVNAVIPPLSLNGPVVTIRKFSKTKLQVEDLIRFGSITREAADFLGACVRARKNIVVSGGTGSGKTTLLNILSSFIPPNERIVTIEDSAELQLSQDHVVRLESRPANLEDKGRITIRDLVINALRMRPDRIVVGECRGGEALDMLQAMNTGHDGSLTTAHANSPRDVLSRLETMCLFTGLEMPLKAIREQISRAIDVVIQQSRLPGGSRSVVQISEVQGMEGDVIITQDLFHWEEGRGLVRRAFAPSFIGDLDAAGYRWPEHASK